MANDRNPRSPGSWYDRENNASYRNDRRSYWDDDRGRSGEGTARDPAAERYGYDARYDQPYGREYPDRDDRIPTYHGDRYGYAMGQFPDYSRPRDRYRDAMGSRRHPDEERGFFHRAADEVSSWFGDDDAERRGGEDHHRGKGPRGYKRSDSRIEEDVNDRLTDDPRLDATEMKVAVASGEVTLSGHAASRWDKRRAEDCAYSVTGVSHVQNNIRIRSREGREEESQGLVDD